MRLEGKLVKWNDERGFGFVKPTQGGREVFVHISAFPRDGGRPRLNEPISFEIEVNRDGKTRAIAVTRPTVGPRVDSRQVHFKASRPSRSRLGVVLLAIVAIIVGVFGYGAFSHRAANAPSGSGSGEVSTSVTGKEQPPLASFRCDGRSYCSQMKSCDEASFFLQNCPSVQMDGDGDGVPCEQQWCN